MDGYVYLEYVGIQNKDLVLGHTDYDFPWSMFAGLYRKHEYDALEGNTYSAIHPCADLKGREFLVFNTKTPAYDENNKIIGIHCHAIEVINPQYFSLVQWLKQSNIDNPLQVYSIGKDFADIKLTSRQSECLFFLLRGKVAKEIARILGISYRTVEEHIEQLKLKFNCHNKSELMCLAIEKGFMNNIPKGLF
jgi:DNA-binding CsgD family transcriptional regulator